MLKANSLSACPVQNVSFQIIQTVPNNMLKTLKCMLQYKVSGKIKVLIRTLLAVRGCYVHRI